MVSESFPYKTILLMIRFSISIAEGNGSEWILKLFVETSSRLSILQALTKHLKGSCFPQAMHKKHSKCLPFVLLFLVSEYDLHPTHAS